jgi:hypothetical protein
MLDVEALAAMLAPVISDEVEKAVAPLNERIAELEARKPEPGPPGEKGEPGERGEKGEAGTDGSNGRDGAGVVDGFINRDGHLIATLSDGTTKDFGEVVGKDGRDGIDATSELTASEDWGDGLSIEDKTGLVSALLRKELGDDDLIILPDPIKVTAAAPAETPPLVIHNHLPKRGIEKTVVTKHDERGRILEFERREV